MYVLGAAVPLEKKNLNHFSQLAIKLFFHSLKKKVSCDQWSDDCYFKILGNWWAYFSNCHMKEYVSCNAAIAVKLLILTHVVSSLYNLSHTFQEWPCIFTTSQVTHYLIHLFTTLGLDVSALTYSRVIKI